ncbi:methyl-accepting chemotaxis sensory transducer with Cache sensor [Desulfoluna spongiiphila]|uniref:Methyl-accepting chemotaxis sensory transducer with Cache sensor n=2 Tax=Desulfoluna spongiiphila TaxID=419481 RepID=A0A1G5JLC3_9BACT|nr:methyl-accepting chemotaxis sensory transducer with Cache sensor [Desulfoluna spongiiphila]VVS91699.1 chemotaxis methyl-accepting receptor [Desulfoluna spongiiphila]
MFGKMGLRGKMLLSICGVVLLSYSVSISYITYNASKMARTEAEEKTLEIASNHGQMIKSELDRAMDVVRTVAHALEGIKMGETAPDRDQINAMLKNMLRQNPDFIAIDTCWEPNALDGRDAEFIGVAGHDDTGRFVPYWNRGTGSIEVEPLVNFDTEAWYQDPKKTGKEIITEPYVYPVGGKDVLMATVVAPIMVDGRFLGIVAVDIALDTFGKMMEKVKPFGTGYGYLVSSGGYTVAHPVKEMVGKNVEEIITGKDQAPFLRALKNGEIYALEREAVKGGQATFQVLAPITVGKTDTPWAIGIVIPFDKVMEGAVHLRNTSIVIGLTGFLLLVAVVWFIAIVLVVKPINGVVHGLRDIAEGEGDLTLRLPVNTQDEIGQLSSWFNNFIEKLQRIVGDLAGQAGAMEGASGALLTVAGDLSTRADNTSERATSVSSAAEEMTTNINGVAASMEQTSSNSDMVATAAEEMTATIGEVAKQSETARSISEKAVRQAGDASTKMARLGEAASAIGSVTEAISEISEQTNLLALNATIEAARAGEAGKGFAVVAGEIKALANQTADATRDIKARVDGIQNITGESVADIEQVTHVISEVNDIVGTIATAVEEQSVATREIAANISQASQGIQEVNGMVAQSSVVITEITQEITEVNTNATDISESSSQVHGSAEELSSMALTLKQVVATFKI